MEQKKEKNEPNVPTKKIQKQQQPSNSIKDEKDIL